MRLREARGFIYGRLLGRGGELVRQALCFTSFNDHVAHHLFPTLDFSQQEKVRVLFLECCEQFNVQYASHTFTELAMGTAKVLQRKEGDLAFTSPRTTSRINKRN